MDEHANCIFCQIVAGKLPCYKIYEDQNYLAFLDIHPISHGHALVIPKHHSQDLLHTPPEDRKGLLEVVAKITPGILKATHSHAFNIGINTGKESGQIVFHTHVHIIPRKQDDGMISWESKKAEHEHLDETAQKIRQAL